MSLSFARTILAQAFLYPSARSVVRTTIRRGILRASIVTLMGLALAIAFQAAPASYADDTDSSISSSDIPAAPSYTPISWDSSVRGAFVTSVCVDNGGRIWAGTEDHGVWRYDGSTASWYQACAPNSLSDTSVYSVACDARGRIWAGTGNHGVAVYNGQRWAYYQEAEGLVGAHVVAIAVSPLDGDVFLATESGINRYSDRTGAWSFYPTSVDGALVQATSLAIDKNGTLYVGTQCDGVLISSAKDNYSSWQEAGGPVTLPAQPQGTGLPSAMVNCVLVAQDGSVWAGTNGGLAFSKDGGSTWSYYCGADWVQKQANAAGAPADAQQTAAAAEATLPFTMREDYITSLAEMPAGHIWIGHRRQGYDILNVATHTLDSIPGSNEWGSDYAVGMVPCESQMLIASYSNGIKTVPLSGLTAAQTTGAQKYAPAHLPNAEVPMPAVAKSSEAVMTAQLADLRALGPSPDEYTPSVTPLPDDWTTQGNWLGRYGTYWISLFALVSPYDYVWGASPYGVDYKIRIGPHCYPGDSVRYWVQWLYSSDPRVLELPTTYLQSRIKRGLTTADANRREAESDDHSEEYPASFDGPNLVVSLFVPAGLYRLSLYEFNKDGHSWDNRYRSYRISIREHPVDVDLDDIDSFPSMPELAHGRVNYFWGGVWKRFAVRGPIGLTIEINKNYSLNTILPAIALDLLDDNPPPYFKTFDQYEKQQATLKQQWSAQIAKGQPVDQSAIAAMPVDNPEDRLLSNLERLKYTDTAWWCTNKDLYYPELLRWYGSQRQTAANGPDNGRANGVSLAKCYYADALYNKAETYASDVGVLTARQIEKSVVWDGKTGDGDGYKVVTAYINSLHGGISTGGAQ